MVDIASIPIRQDFNGVKRRILGRGGHISEQEFRVSFPTGIDALVGKDPLPSLTIHQGRKSSGPALLTLVRDHERGTSLQEGSNFFSLRDLKENAMGISLALQTQDRIPICKTFPDRPPAIIAYATKPNRDPA